MITRCDFSRAMGVAAIAATSATACSSPPAAPSNSTGRTSFPALKQVDAGLLDVGYAEDGPGDGPPVIMLHGWPHDIYSYVDVAPLLVANGYRVIVPYLRGFGTTHFLSDKTFRNGQQAALAADIVAFMDALKIPQAAIGGFDWGTRTACVIAALSPQRCKALVSVIGYLIVNLATNLKPLAPQAELGLLLLDAARRARLSAEHP
jgi:pimeloyl-ACP methyl ester carboxylesterase